MLFLLYLYAPTHSGSDWIMLGSMEYIRVCVIKSIINKPIEVLEEDVVVVYGLTEITTMILI